MVTLLWKTARKAPRTFCRHTTEALLQQPSGPGVHKTRRWVGTLLKDMHKVIRGKTGGSKIAEKPVWLAQLREMWEGRYNMNSVPQQKSQQNVNSKATIVFF